MLKHMDRHHLIMFHKFVSHSDALTKSLVLLVVMLFAAFIFENKHLGTFELQMKGENELNLIII